MAHRQLTDDDIAKAVKLLNGWTGELTWKRFLLVFSADVGGHVYSKVAMHNKPKIKAAWKSAKTRSSSGATGSTIEDNGDPAVVVALREAQRQKARAEQAERERDELLEKFRLSSYNSAMILGLTEEQLEARLNTPLPEMGNRR